MSEELKPVQDVSQETGITPAAVTEPMPTISKDEYDKVKRENSGLDRKIAELTKALELKDLEKLSADEQAQKKLEMLNNEIKQKEEYSANLEKQRIIDKALFNSGIPPEFAKRIKGQDESEILQDVKEFKEFIDNLVNIKSDKMINEKLGGKAPVSGSIPVGNDLQSQYNEARKQNNFPLQTAIKRKAISEGIILQE